MTQYMHTVVGDPVTTAKLAAVLADLRGFPDHVAIEHQSVPGGLELRARW